MFVNTFPVYTGSACRDVEFVAYESWNDIDFWRCNNNMWKKRVDTCSKRTITRGEHWLIEW